MLIKQEINKDTSPGGRASINVDYLCKNFRLCFGSAQLRIFEGIGRPAVDRVSLPERPEVIGIVQMSIGHSPLSKQITARCPSQVLRFPHICAGLARWFSGQK